MKETGSSADCPEGDATLATRGTLPLCHFAIVPLLASFPFRDWQFWATTAVFLLAVAWLLREVLPVPILKRFRRRGKKKRRVTLTVEGRVQK